MKTQRILNWVLSFLLILVCAWSVRANYRNVDAMAAIIVSNAYGLLLSIVVILQVYNYQDYRGYNPCSWWFVLSAISWLILAVTFELLGFGQISIRLSKALMMGMPCMSWPFVAIILAKIGNRIKWR